MSLMVFSTDVRLPTMSILLINLPTIPTTADREDGGSILCTSLKTVLQASTIFLPGVMVIVNEY